jgi:hypothetical protein
VEVIRHHAGRRFETKHPHSLLPEVGLRGLLLHVGGEMLGVFYHMGRLVVITTEMLATLHGGAEITENGECSSDRQITGHGERPTVDQGANNSGHQLGLWHVDLREGPCQQVNSALSFLHGPE